MITQFRHGDVFLEEGSVPSDAVLIPGNLLAQGSSTGNSHTLAGDAQIYRNSDGTWVLVGAAGATLNHAEHSTIPLPPGSYEVSIQREWTPEGEQEVSD